MTVSQENVPPPQAVEPQNDKEKNLALQRKMYERQLEEERKARSELEKRLADLETANHRNRRGPEDDDEDDDSEPYIDKKTLKKQFNRFAQEMQSDIDKRAEEKARSLLEQEKQLSFMKQNSDFNSILTEENVAKFAEKHPEMAEDFLSMPNSFARQKLLYQNIKALGIHRKEEPKQSIQEVVNKNQRSPYYMPSSVSGTPPYAAQGDFSQKGIENAYLKMKDLIRNKRG